MKWPWETKKPVHDPTRNHDIHNIDLTDTWNYPDVPLYTIPENFWCQILGVSIQMDTIDFVRPAAPIILVMNHNGRNIFANPSHHTVLKLKTIYYSWTPLGFISGRASTIMHSTTSLSTSLYLFPGDQITFLSEAFITHDLFYNFTIQVKRWEFY